MIDIDENFKRPVEDAIESLRDLADTPGCQWAALYLAEIVRSAALEVADDTKLENILRCADGSDTAAASAVMTAWQRHLRESPALTSPASVTRLCDRMDELTDGTRRALANEGNEHQEQRK
ncbi:hypothetical protein ACKAMS_26765 [Rhodococcus sp. 5A-K4]|uniref:hypothetical protein n=1 Tax=Rhodococcus sp. 5A-K4 TaxID=3384442 RepID=UPI001369FC28|nr:hypothetical protein [Rhodococcus erythropolis]